MNDPLRALASTPLYLCLPPIRGAAGGDLLNSQFPFLVGPVWKPNQLKQLVQRTFKKKGRRRRRRRRRRRGGTPL
jgi:hypothetical protein